MEFWKRFKEESIEVLVSAGMRIAFGLVIFIIGLILIRYLRRVVFKIIDKSKMDLSLKRFVESLSIVVLYALLIFCVGISLGIKASAFMTALGAASIAIGLALQGSLSNFAGGLLILIFKPFRIGDEVQLNGIWGVVDDIDILYTRVSDWRGQIYTLPNGKVSNEMVLNLSATGVRRIEIELHFALDEDFDRLREIIINEMKKFPKALKDRPFQFRFSGFQDYYIKASARCWSTDANYWEVYWGQMEAIKKALERNNIQLEIPYHKIKMTENKKNMP